MDHYTFPHISHISQALAAIKDRPEFIVAERDRHTVVNYMMAGNDTFPRVLETGSEKLIRRPHVTVAPEYDIDYAIRRECRGIVFGPDGTVIARRFHKFFNLGEKEETAIDTIDFKRHHVILDKLDGSMITPIPIADDGKTIKNGYHVRWGTKMGLTAVAFQAEEFVSDKLKYRLFAQWCIDRGKTPIFEWCSRKQRIVIDYLRDMLELLAVRDNVTGVYDTYDDLWDYGVSFDIPVCPILPDEMVTDPEKFREFVRGRENIEGYVVRFDDGHMLKVKGDWYVRIHRAKDSILQEKRVVEMIVNEKTDDVLSFLLESDHRALSEFQDEFLKNFRDTADRVWRDYQVMWRINNGDKKSFAIGEESRLMNQTIRSTIFAVWGMTSPDGVTDHLRKFVLKNLGSQTKVDSVRWIWGDVKWADYIQAEDEASDD